MATTILAKTVQAKLAHLRSHQHSTAKNSDMWTQKRLANYLGIDASTLSLKLSGKRELSIFEAKKLADFLGFDLNSFFQLLEMDRY